ncbi:MAG: hypothetical protein DRJ03_15880 [Chloroflexi bacterium]|nr:MAG: hypothetical protein B6I34_01890 [Anaerolineaceae bacterium 4572_32.1]RLC73617.1 MAG: hypothetical protein DRI81_14870 [Chloroflexota bacterium]RLC83865.1 MAG: hypothetical protein DRJ03_15880 [Chloroflexota bacterium]HEY72313.1 GAF domain-containing sensor histidine kinase [Thermoflexia bacterium]
MATERIINILMSVNKGVQRLLEVDRFYVALYDPVKAELEFPLVVDSGNMAETDQASWIPRPYQGHAWLPDRAIEQKAPLLFERDLRKRLEGEGIRYWPDGGKLPLSWLGVPMTVEGRVIGTLVVENRYKARAFGNSGVRVLSTIARQTALTIENVRLHERLERKIANLRAVNEVGRRLTLGIRLSEQEILELIYEQASLLMDTSDMYIALYEPDSEQPDEYNSEKPEESVIHGTVRFGLAMDNKRQVDTEHEKGWEPRKAGHGLTEYVIRTKLPYRPSDVEKAYKTIATEYIGKTPRSWMGVPMMVGNKVLGVVVLRNDEYENVYDKDDEEVLQTIAGQAAVAIENARLYADQRKTIRILEEAQDKIRQLERVRTMSNMAADFVHRINNMAGTIPIRVQRIREILSDKYPEARRSLRRHLKGIMDDTNELLMASQRLQESTQEIPQPQLIDVHDLVATIVREIRLQTPDFVKVYDEHLETELPPVLGIEAELEEAIRDVTTNAIEAMVNTGGRFDISTAYKQDKIGEGWVEIEVKDEGYGIPEDVLHNIFDLFYTTKGSSLGYGLWRTKNTVESLGGEITVDSEVGKGTTVHIRLPAAKRLKE